MIRRAPITFALAAAALVVAGTAGAAAASTAPSDPAAQARADAAITAFDSVATEAGYPSDGSTSPGSDLIGLSADSIGSDEASACLADAAAHVETDGSFIGQVATAGSATYGTAAETAVATAATVAPSGFGRVAGTTAPEDETYIDLEASVAIVDEASAGELVSLAEALADDAVTGCFEDAFRSLGEEQGVEFSELSTSAESLDIGDASAQIEIAVAADFDGTPVTFTSILGVAVAGDGVAVVSYSVDNGEPDDAIVVDGLEAMVDALSAG